jgi:hypothetical protein
MIVYIYKIISKSIIKRQTGKHPSQQTKDKISNSLKNHIVTEETREKISKSLLNRNKTKF